MKMRKDDVDRLNKAYHIYYKKCSDRTLEKEDYVEYLSVITAINDFYNLNLKKIKFDNKLLVMRDISAEQIKKIVSNVDEGEQMSFELN